MPKDEIDSKVKEAARDPGYRRSLLDRKPKAAFRRPASARGASDVPLSASPKVFLMDEPLSNLDAKLRNQMRAEIIKLRQSIGYHLHLCYP